MSKTKQPTLQVPSSPMESPMDGSEKDYDAKRAFETIMDAQKHRADPGMMKRVHAVAGRHMKALKSIKSVQDIKDAYNDKFGAKTSSADDEMGE